MYERVLMIEKFKTVADKYGDYFKMTARSSSKMLLDHLIMMMTLTYPWPI
jgi:hypothetical protein